MRFVRKLTAVTTTLALLTGVLPVAARMDGVIIARISKDFAEGLRLAETRGLHGAFNAVSYWPALENAERITYVNSKNIWERTAAMPDMYQLSIGQLQLKGLKALESHASVPVPGRVEDLELQDLGDEQGRFKVSYLSVAPEGQSQYREEVYKFSGLSTEKGASQAEIMIPEQKEIFGDNYSLKISLPMNEKSGGAQIHISVTEFNRGSGRRDSWIGQLVLPEPISAGLIKNYDASADEQIIVVYIDTNSDGYSKKGLSAKSALWYRIKLPGASGAASGTGRLDFEPIGNVESILRKNRLLASMHDANEYANQVIRSKDAAENRDSEAGATEGFSPCEPILLR